VNKRLLLGCFGVPNQVGSSTVLYLLFERLQREGFDVAYVNLVNQSEESFFGETVGNPRALPGVHTCILKPPLWRPQSALAQLIDSFSPDLLFAFGLIAARSFQLTAPSLPVVYMTAGSRQLSALIETGAIADFLNFKKRVDQGVTFRLPPEDPERKAVENAELIFVHSPLIRFMYDHYFPSHVGKIYVNVISVADFIYAEAERFRHLARPFPGRDIDAIFVASRWNRPEKNYPLLRKIASRSHGLNLHVVGAIDRPCPSVRHHGMILQREIIYELLGRAKSLVCPSVVDAAPGVLFEASAMGCNVIASPNCGNWQLCNEDLLAGNCSPDTFLHRIERALSRLYTDHQENFRGGYQDLVETLTVL
jgi:glycosyltransferase involved in cell wall biosynthesis